jgi:hypothetical protein
MKNKAEDIRSYLFKFKQSLFFDANIWFYLFGPQEAPPPPASRIYSDALKRALQTKSVISRRDRPKEFGTVVSALAPTSPRDSTSKVFDNPQALPL